jgi:environmental stress-induced protein Ves
MTLKITHNSASDYVEIPLSNGKGSTTEIAKYPSDAAANQPYYWKMTLAKRESSGIFPTFPGYDRSIMQLSGKTMTLLHEKHGAQKLAPLLPYTFKGEWETERRLIGKAEDFNLYVRSQRLSSKIERIDLKDRKPLSKWLKLHTVLWVYQGAVEWECGSEKYALKEGDTLAIESAESLEYILKAKRALCFLITIEDKEKPQLG